MEQDIKHRVDENFGVTLFHYTPFIQTSFLKECRPQVLKTKHSECSYDGTTVPLLEILTRRNVITKRSPNCSDFLIFLLGSFSFPNIKCQKYL